MRKIGKSFVSVICCVLLLAGCAAAPVPRAGGGTEPRTGADGTEILILRIVDGAETGELVLAGAGAGEVYTLSAGSVPICLDGRDADAAALEDGMTVEVEYDWIETTWPARIAGARALSAYSLGTEKNPGGSCYDLCGLYLQVLEDLWNRDSGLNEGISYLSLDLSEAPGELSEGERAAIAWIFAGAHNAEPLTLTYQQLAEQGYLTEIAAGKEGRPAAYQWEDGLLFTITADKQAEAQIYSLPVVRFEAMKWRTPLGAYFFTQCSAVWPEMGTWSGYTIGGEAIS